MSQLIRLRDIQATHRDLIGDDYYDPTGKTAYGVNEEKIGKIEGALVEDTTGRIRYLIVDAGGWFSSKEVLVPAGLARIVGDDVFFDSLTQAQVEAMEVYDHDYQYSYKEQYEKTLHIEARVAVTIAKTMVVPAALQYQHNLAYTVAHVKAAGCDNVGTQQLLQELSRLTEKTLSSIKKLESCIEAHAIGSMLESMHALRVSVDSLEGLIPYDMWPLPSYAKMLFLK